MTDKVKRAYLVMVRDGNGRLTSVFQPATSSLEARQEACAHILRTNPNFVGKPKAVDCTLLK